MPVPGGSVSAEPEGFLLPSGSGPHPAVVIGAEAYGPNPFIRAVQQRLGDLGYASAVPDYYRGTGPANSEAYDSFDEVIEHIARLDFTSGTRDLVDTIDALRARPDIDSGRVAVWGYCTGGTLAWLAACERGDVAAAVLYFPSQPVFHEHGPKTPVDPIDLIWQLTCPTLFLYGDEDPVVSPELMVEIQRRIDQWGVDAEIRHYPGAGHAFSAPWGPMRHEEADAAAWDDAVTFLRKHSGA